MRGCLRKNIWMRWQISRLGVLWLASRNGLCKDILLSQLKKDWLSTKSKTKSCTNFIAGVGCTMPCKLCINCYA